LELDKTDRQIIKLLQEDASISNLELSKLVGLSPSACLSRTKRLKESGVIKQYTAIVDESKLGMEIIAFITVSIAPYNKEIIDNFIEQIRKLPQVLECYTMAGSKDFLLKVVAPNMHKYKEYVVNTLVSIPGISGMETNVVISIDKWQTSIPLEE